MKKETRKLTLTQETLRSLVQGESRYLMADEGIQTTMPYCPTGTPTGTGTATRPCAD